MLKYIEANIMSTTYFQMEREMEMEKGREERKRENGKMLTTHESRLKVSGCSLYYSFISSVGI